MSKHTPGPWVVGPIPGSDECHFYIEADSAGRDICDMAHPDGDASDEDMANARLIAAAPEMAGLLREYVARWVGSDLETRARALLSRLDGA